MKLEKEHYLAIAFGIGVLAFILMIIIFRKQILKALGIEDLYSDPGSRQYHGGGMAGFGGGITSFGTRSYSTPLVAVPTCPSGRYDINGNCMEIVSTQTIPAGIVPEKVPVSSVMI